MDPFKMEECLNLDELYNLSFDFLFKPDSSYNFEADSRVFDMDFLEANADLGGFLDSSPCSYPDPEYAFDSNPFPKNTLYDTFNTTSDLATSDLQISQLYQGADIPVPQSPKTRQLCSVTPSLDISREDKSLLCQQSAATGSSNPEQSRRDSACSTCSDITYASSKSSAGSEDVLANNAASIEASPAKVRKKRGRKRANISETERRSRKLMRGRIAANKCRQKKRLRENDLESKACQLLVERDEMLQLNHDLRDEVIKLQAEVLTHVSGKCGGFPDAEQVMSSMNTLSEMLQEVERKRDEFKNILDNQSYKSDAVIADTGLSQ